jgi:secreted Zn-dependent insulinase-like peptidase
MSALFLRQGPRALLVGFFALFCVACASVPQAPEQPVQSANDDYQYRLLTLPNALQVLLISDPDATKGAASLDVQVGSGDNPVGREGLAHFLEHMLFLGTDKYPDPAEYERFITEHGGSRNAYTSFENTNYFFDVNAAYLPEALDRFAQFFIAPKFDAAYVDREKNAVEAEYQMGLKSDPRRGLDVLQEVINPAHPYSQFSVGSLETLADRPGSDIRDELISFYETYYSANIMKLVVLGSQSLDELEALVVPMFSAVPNHSYQQDEIRVPLFEEGSLPMLVKFQPQATQRQLDLSFPIPDYREDYNVKPVSYLSNLVGHEGDGSLLSQLKAEGLAEGLAAGTGLTWPGGAMFSVSISLTERGVVDYQRVLSLFFAYVKMLQREGAKEWLYDEQSRLADLGFRFRQQVEPISYVSAISGGMHDYAPADILRGPYIMDRYDEALLDDLLGTITSENALVTLSDKSVETDRVSRFYQVPYSRETLGAEQVAAWQAEADSPGEDLHLPEPNEFIAANVALVDIDQDHPDAPTVALEMNRQKIWFLQDKEYRVPKGATYINFRSPEVGQTVEQTASAVLYAALLKDEVNEYAYPALLAGLNFEFYKHAQGISLRVTGYNDKQALLLEELLAEVAEPDFDPQRFDNIRKDMIRALRNSVAGRPSSQVMADLQEALLYGEWGEQALIASLEQLAIDDLQDYVRRFWATATAEVLIYGNYRKDMVQQVSGMLDEIITEQPAPELPELRVLKLAPGESLLYSVDVPHDDSVVAWYLQGAGNSWRDRAATALTAQIMKSGFFQQLRTEQQLGYVAAAFAWPQLDVPGLVMLIQSPVADAARVAEAMQSYMEAVPADLDQDQFNRHRAALLHEIRRPDENLWDRAGFYWQSIAMKQWQFDGREELADAVTAFDLDSWLAYYRRVFLEQPHSLQVVAPGRWDILPATDARRADSAEAIKSGHEYYLID